MCKQVCFFWFCSNSKVSEIERTVLYCDSTCSGHCGRLQKRLSSLGGQSLPPRFGFWIIGLERSWMCSVPHVAPQWDHWPQLPSLQLVAEINVCLAIFDQIHEIKNIIFKIISKCSLKNYKRHLKFHFSFKYIHYVKPLNEWHVFTS